MSFIIFACLFTGDNALSVFQTQSGKCGMRKNRTNGSVILQKNHTITWTIGVNTGTITQIFSCRNLANGTEIRTKAKLPAALEYSTNESFHRFRAIAFGKNLYNDKNWTTRTARDVYNFYQFVETADVWAAVFKMDFSYNQFYELMYKSGISIHQSPYLPTPTAMIRSKYIPSQVFL